MLDATDAKTETTSFANASSKKHEPDTSKPTTKIQIVLHPRQRVVATFNTDATVLDLYQHIKFLSNAPTFQMLVRYLTLYLFLVSLPMGLSHKLFIHSTLCMLSQYLSSTHLVFFFLLSSLFIFNHRLVSHQQSLPIHHKHLQKRTLSMLLFNKKYNL